MERVEIVTSELHNNIDCSKFLKGMWKQFDKRRDNFQVPPAIVR